MKRTLRVALALLGCALATACKTVQPWERGNLVKPQMSLDAERLQSALRAHAYGSREALAGASNAQGSGC